MEEERRVSKRIIFASPVRYYPKGSQKYSDTIGKDISDSGIGFVSSEFIPKATQLLFELNPPTSQARSQTIGEVVWISSQPYSERFYVGVKFLEPFMPA